MLQLWDMFLLSNSVSFQLTFCIDRDKGFRKWITRRIMTFTLAFFIAWTPSTLNRVSGIFGARNFTLAILQAIVSPMRGLINFIAFLHTRKSPKQDLKPRQDPLNDHPKSETIERAVQEIREIVLVGQNIT